MRLFTHKDKVFVATPMATLASVVVSGWLHLRFLATISEPLLTNPNK
jgi:hypothetical protein